MENKDPNPKHLDQDNPGNYTTTPIPSNLTYDSSDDDVHEDQAKLDNSEKSEKNEQEQNMSKGKKSKPQRKRKTIPDASLMKILAAKETGLRRIEEIKQLEEEQRRIEEDERLEPIKKLNQKEDHICHCCKNRFKTQKQDEEITKKRIELLKLYGINPEAPHENVEKSKKRKPKIDSQQSKSDQEKNPINPEVIPVEEIKLEEDPSESSSEQNPETERSFTYRTPLISILGHVDTGKTKLINRIIKDLDISKNNSGFNRAQSVDYRKLEKEVSKCKDINPVEIQVPGLMFLDYASMESKPRPISSDLEISDFAIIVIDIFHGIEKSTLDALKALKVRKLPFIIALNKIDRLYGWKTVPNSSIQKSLEQQNESVINEFYQKIEDLISSLGKVEVNSALCYENGIRISWKLSDSELIIPIVPTSAITGEGIPDLLACSIKMIQEILREKIILKEKRVKCTVIDIKEDMLLGPLANVILIEGTIKEGDNIVIGSAEGAIESKIKSITTLNPLKQNTYQVHKEVLALARVRISAENIQKALPGTELYIYREDSEQQFYKDLANNSILKFNENFVLSEEGIVIVAPSFASLEALYEFLKDRNIPVSKLMLGDVTEEVIKSAMVPLSMKDSVLREHATVLAFDIKVLSEARDLAKKEGVEIISSNIIYHLIDKLDLHIINCRKERIVKEGLDHSIFPCILKTTMIFHKKNPIILGINILEGILKVGTPICALEKGCLSIGSVEKIQKNGREIQEARPNDGPVAIQVSGLRDILIGRHFDQEDTLISLLTRESIDALKLYHRDELEKKDWQTVIKLKKLLNIPNPK